MTDDQYNRLLRAAAHAPVPPSSEMPFGFETRVIAQWLTQPAPDWRFEDTTLALIRRSLAFACVVALGSLALSYHTLTSSPSAELAVANSALEVNFAP